MYGLESPLTSAAMAIIILGSTIVNGCMCMVNFGTGLMNIHGVWGLLLG